MYAIRSYYAVLLTPKVRLTIPIVSAAMLRFTAFLPVEGRARRGRGMGRVSKPGMLV